MNSAFQRIKSDPNLLIPYVLAILFGGVLIMLILWRALSADAGVPSFRRDIKRRSNGHRSAYTHPCDTSHAHTGAVASESVSSDGSSLVAAT
jgi:hypothetical protein